MNKVSESIWSNRNYIIPMDEVSYIEKQFHSCDLANGSKKGDLAGITVVMKHSTWNVEVQEFDPNVYINEPDASKFIQDWCFFRHESEGGSERFIQP